MQKQRVGEEEGKGERGGRQCGPPNLTTVVAPLSAAEF
jgi:hypothetical protein